MFKKKGYLAQGKRIHEEAEALTDHYCFAPWSCLGKSKLEEKNCHVSQLNCGMGSRWHHKEMHMATVEIDDTLWAEFCSLSEQFEMPSPGDFLKWCLRRIIKFEEVADGRYAPVCCAIVTRDESEILLVGNDYKTGQPLFWNLPGGAVDLGEDLRHAAVREAYEESGLEVLQVGRLAWVVQIYNGPEHPSFLVFAFEVIVWRGDITLKHEVEGGAVCCAEFVPYAEACKRLGSTTAVPLRDWLTESRNTPQIYSVKGVEDTLVESQVDK